MGCAGCVGAVGVVVVWVAVGSGGLWWVVGGGL